MGMEAIGSPACLNNERHACQTHKAGTPDSVARPEARALMGDQRHIKSGGGQ
jgi:hypothetical protein